MEPKSFEQVQIKREVIRKKNYFTENLVANFKVFYNDVPISIELPKQINCKIETTERL